MQVTCTTYEIGENGKMIAIDETAGTGLQPGTVLRWGGNVGWSARDLVIIREKTSTFGSSYACYDRDEPENNAKLHYVEASSVKKPDAPGLRHGQHMFLTGEIVSGAEVLAMRGDHKRQADAQEAQQDKATEERDAQEAAGRKLWAELMPAGTKHILVAEHMHDDSDIQTDYFSSHATDKVILAASKHGRDNFAEMRKASKKIPETEHLSTAPTVDRNNEPKTESNRSWWHPADEQREKYSGGSGYYLQIGGCHSSGWLVRKDSACGYQGTEPTRDILISLAQRNDHLRK